MRRLLARTDQGDWFWRLFSVQFWLKITKLFSRDLKIIKENNNMRFTEDRYAQDKNRMDLALRMIQHEARTTTIRECTGLSDDRIRKLYKSYAAAGSTPVRRHRGKSPTQSAFFFKNPAHRRQSATLAGLYALLGLLNSHTPSEGGSRAAIARGALFCRTYETYLQLDQSRPLSFEHAWRLLSALQTRAEIIADTCTRCQGLMVIDRLGARHAHCTWCEQAIKHDLSYEAG